ncbi:hypothetical protein ABOM_001619 [Aspergillus bombycis]|uniref:Major facilitator superfamily (MFS) profile domain-containing protein n=1 Tax=Aspergillus bombycis TaxID=109264 RepID=A0A1F8AD46_9EURO|nr:hypothetical protein ABOM_001619 [Aspergillus bombycis]OGM49602.1 hypothetical protein ABOM_001619 [Aspergillus bombycis]
MSQLTEAHGTRDLHMEIKSQNETMELQERSPPQETPNEHISTQSSKPEEVKWRYAKVLSAGLSFFVAGINDGSLGSIIPYIIRTYGIGTNMIAVLYGTTFFGWLLAALTNSFLTNQLDLGWILGLGALGQAYNDTHANTFVSSLNGAHRLLGFIHAMYMGGCLVGPFVATGVASANTDSKWYLFYLFPLGIGVANLVLVGVSFHDRMRRRQSQTAEPYVPDQRATNSAMKEMKDTLATPAVWLLSLFFFFLLGATITTGGWMVEFLVNVRDGDVSKMGYVPAGFYGGAFLGRLVLAEPTHRFGERRMVFLYSILCVGFQLLFWLVPNIITEAVAVSLLGFFSGPIFAAGISVGTKIIKAEIRSSALAFVFVLGQVGGSIFPAFTGIIAAQKGVQVLQPVLVALWVATGGSWLILPRDLELHRD